MSIYWQIGLVAIGVGVGVILVSVLVKRLMHLDTLQDEPELAGYKEVGEQQAAGMFPNVETKPEREQF